MNKNVMASNDPVDHKSGFEERSDDLPPV